MNWIKTKTYCYIHICLLSVWENIWQRDDNEYVVYRKSNFNPLALHRENSLRQNRIDHQLRKRNWWRRNNKTIHFFNLQIFFFHQSIIYINITRMLFLLEQKLSRGSSVANKSFGVSLSPLFRLFKWAKHDSYWKKNWHAKFLYAISVLPPGYNFFCKLFWKLFWN